MRTEDMPWWLHGIDIVGFEEEDDDSEEDDDEEESEEEDDDEESDDEDEDEDDEGEDDDDESKPNVEGLKSALRKERMERKRLARELKKLKSSQTKPKPKRKAKDEDEEDEEAQSSEELEAERKKNERLAVRLRDQAIDSLIRKHAGKFADPDDAVNLVNRNDIEWDQDEDDPSEIEVDEESVQDAVKALAKKKKHLLATNSKGGSKSGSKFGGKGKGKKGPTDEQLRQKYAALRR